MAYTGVLSIAEDDVETIWGVDLSGAKLEARVEHSPTSEDWHMHAFLMYESDEPWEDPRFRHYTLTVSLRKLEPFISFPPGVVIERAEWSSAPPGIRLTLRSEVPNRWCREHGGRESEKRLRVQGEK